MFHKILQGSVALNLPHEVSLLHTTTIYIYMCVSKYHFQELTQVNLVFPATVRLWNRLPNSVVHLDYPESFRRSVTDFLN